MLYCVWNPIENQEFMWESQVTNYPAEKIQITAWKLKFLYVNSNANAQRGRNSVFSRLPCHSNACVTKMLTIYSLHISISSPARSQIVKVYFELSLVFACHAKILGDAIKYFFEIT